MSDTEAPKHEVDAGGARNLRAEKDAIAQSLTRKEPEPTNKFKTLVQSTPEGFNLRKVKGNRSSVTYYPDTYCITELSQRMFTIASKDSKIRKDPDCNIFAWTFYIFHCLMYHILVNVDFEHSEQYHDCIKMYEDAGYGSNLVPSFFKDWIAGLGRYTDEVSKRYFSIGDINSELFDENTGCLTLNLAHLLPNFAILRVLALTRKADTLPAKYKGWKIFFGCSSYPTAALNVLLQARPNAFKFPGITQLMRAFHESESLIFELNNFTTPVAGGVYDFLVISKRFLIYLRDSVSPIFPLIDTITLGTPSCLGSELLMLNHNSVTCHQTEIRPVEVIAAIAAGPTSMEELTIPVIIDHRFLIRARVMIENGTLYASGHTPIVRMAADAERITGEDEPNDRWYNEYEFTSGAYSLNEFHGLFLKN